MENRNCVPSKQSEGFYCRYTILLPDYLYSTVLDFAGSEHSNSYNSIPVDFCKHLLWLCVDFPIQKECSLIKWTKSTLRHPWSHFAWKGGLFGLYMSTFESVPRHCSHTVYSTFAWIKECTEKPSQGRLKACYPKGAQQSCSYLKSECITEDMSRKSHGCAQGLPSELNINRRSLSFGVH